VLPLNSACPAFPVRGGPAGKLARTRVAARRNGPLGAGLRARACACGNAQNNLGPGRESAIPPGPKEAREARVDLDRRTEMNGRAFFSADQKPRRRPLALTLAHSPFQRLHLLHPSEREQRRPAVYRRHGEPPCRHARPLQGERTTVERHHRGAQIQRSERHVGGSRGPYPHSAHGLARSGRRAGVPFSVWLGLGFLWALFCGFLWVFPISNQHE
jgi:hypothetical protein